MTFGNLKLRSHDGEFRSKEPGIRTAAKRNFVHPPFQVQKHCEPKTDVMSTVRHVGRSHFISEKIL